MSKMTSMVVEKLKNLSPKQKQYLMLGSFCTLFFGLIIGSVKLWGNKPMAEQIQHTEIKTKDIATPGAQVDPKDVWMMQSAQEMKGMNDTLDAVQQKLKDMEKAKAASSVSSVAPGILPPLQPLPKLPPLRPLPQPMSPRSNVQDNAANSASVPLQLQIKKEEPPKEPGIIAVEVSDAAPKANIETSTDKDIYIPSGTFMRVVLLGGLDASTGGQAQNNPWPVLMHVQSNAFLPNKFRAQVKQCRVLGSGFGDLSSERASIRLESFSCVLKDGSVIDSAIKGYVVGEDGKAGMQGRLVSKQGQVLANALLVGLVSGIGQGVSTMSTTSTMSAYGGINTVTPGQQIAAGVGTGVGTALGKLSQYYLTLADKIFPIIEVDAGRVVDIVLTKGIKMSVASPGQNQLSGLFPDEDQYSAVWKKGSQLLHKSLDPIN